MNDVARTAIVIQNYQEAALYFDYLIPIGFDAEFLRLLNRLDAKEIQKAAFLHPSVLYEQLLPPTLAADKEFTKRLRLATSRTAAILKSGFVKYGNNLSPAQNEQIQKQCVRALGRGFIPALLRDFKLPPFPIVCAAEFGLLDGTKTDVLVTLSSLRIIDADRAEWEQVLEFRKDADARAKLRRLRLFAYDNYVGKPKTYIEDHIFTKIAEHDAAVKKWGFETTTAAYNAVFNSKLLVGTISSSLIASLFGQTALSVATAAGGVGIELGKLAIELRKVRFAFTEQLSDNPVSYISRARELIETKK